MTWRKLLLSIKFFVRYRREKRRKQYLMRRVSALSAELKEKEREIAQHYEVLLEQQRLMTERVLLSSTDRVFQAFKLTAISQDTIGLREEAERRVNPSLRPPEPEPEDLLYGEELNYYLDAKDNFIEAEMETGKSKAEARRLWDKEFRQQAVMDAKTSIIQ